jgi:hypothetical protein
VLRGGIVAAVLVIAVLKTADFAMFTALGRGFNPVADLALVEAGLRLVTGAIGAGLTILAGVAVLAVTAALGAALWWATGVWSRAMPAHRGARAGLALGAVMATGVAAAEIGTAMGRWSLPVEPPGAAFTARVGLERWETGRATLADLRAFEAEAARDPWAGRAGLLDLIDRDVILVFVESYGRTSHDTPFYADLHRATLAAGAEELAARGWPWPRAISSRPRGGGKAGWRMRRLRTGSGSTGRRGMARRWPRGGGACSTWRRRRGCIRRR